MKWGVPMLSGGIIISTMVAFPVWAYTHLPLAGRAAVQAFMAAADRVQQATLQQKTEGDAVLVPWEDVISLEAVLLQQNFDQLAGPELNAGAEAVTWRFVERHEVVTTDCDDDGCSSELHRWFTRKPLETVVAEAQFTEPQRNWALTIRQNADLVRPDR